MPESKFWKATPKKVVTLWNEYLRLTGKTDEEQQENPQSEIVYRDGKKYRKVDPKNASWLRK